MIAVPTAPYEAAVVRSDRILRRLVRGLDGISLRVGSGGGSGNSDGEMVPAASRTLVVVVGDHGEAFGEGGHRQHGSCVHVACLQVPFVVFDPFSHSTMMAAMTRMIMVSQARLVFLQTASVTQCVPEQETVA